MNNAMIPLERLCYDKSMYLRNFNNTQESLKLLKESMKDGYNAEHPLDVIPVGEYYRILDGVKRYLVCKELGYDPVPCHVMTEEEGLKSLRQMLLR